MLETTVIDRSDATKSSPTEKTHLNERIPMRLLIYPAFEPAWNEALRDAARPAEVVVAKSEAEALALVGDCEVFVGYITPELLAAAKRLRWIQAPLAGLESYMFPALIESSVVLSNMRGI